MLNYIKILLLIPVICFSTSCSMVGPRTDVGGSRLEMLNKSTDGEQANARLENIIEIIKDQDKEALRALFSNDALNKADDFDENAGSLFEFIQGEIESWEKLSGPTVFDSVNGKHVTKKVSSYYHVSTDRQKYFFLLDDFPIDTKNRNNVGLHLLLVVKEDDEKEIYDGDNQILFDGERKIPRFGVYLPFI